MSNTPQYKTKIIKLPHGIRIGDELHSEITIRQQNVGDIIHTIQPNGNVLIGQFKQVARRVLSLGMIENPGETLLETLLPADYDTVIDAMEQMDGDTDEEETDSKKNSP